MPLPREPSTVAPTASGAVAIHNRRARRYQGSRMRVAAPVARPSAAVPGIAVETRPRDSNASIDIVPGPRTMIQPSRTAQYRCSGDGPSEPCRAQASNKSGSATMREQRPMMSSVGHRVAITPPSGVATTWSTVGAIALAMDIVIGTWTAMLTTASVRNALASQKRMARSSQAPATAPKAWSDVKVESTAGNRVETPSLRSKSPRFMGPTSEKRCERTRSVRGTGRLVTARPMRSRDRVARKFS